MNKRPIPTPQAEDEFNALDKFIDDAPKNIEVKNNVANKKVETTQRKNRKLYQEEELVKKSIKIDILVDTALRLEAVHTRNTQEKIVEEALRTYLKTRGHKNI